VNKTTAGLLGAVAGLATMGSAQAGLRSPAATAEALHAPSYADLLAPVANAVALQREDDAARMRIPAGGVELADDNGYNRDHHHHHHHHRYYRREYQPRQYHHHHHHGAFVGVPGVGGVVIHSN
jgi:hypothetical protein